MMARLLLFTTRLLALLPARPLVAVAGAAGRAAARLGLARRDVAEANIRIAFGDALAPREVRRIAVEATGNLFMALAESVLITHRPPGWAATLVEAVDHPDRMPPRGVGGVAATGHFGSWEVLGAWGAQQLDLVTLAKPLHNEALQEAVAASRARNGITVLWVRGSDVVARMAEAVSRGAMVNVLVDQDAGVHGAFIPFFGRPASTVLSPAVLAIRKRVPLRVGFIVRIGACRHRVELREPIDPAQFRGTIEERAGAMMAEVHRHLEDVIRQHPTQYFWHHRRWRTTPEAARKRLETLERRRRERATTAPPQP